MRPFDTTSALPEFAAEYASSDADRAELAELLAELSVVNASDISAREVDHGRARLLGAVRQSSERFAPLFDQLTKFFDLSAEALRNVFARAERENEWQEGPLPWVSLFHFAGGPAVAGLDTGFVKLKKGTPFPAHRHLGSERVLILEGSYHDHEQRYYGPGDFHDMTDGTEHSLVMSATEDVLLAVIMSGEIQVIAP
jgi:ChrR Cupin-like domain